jgi:hypothetical protein
MYLGLKTVNEKEGREDKGSNPLKVSVQGSTKNRKVVLRVCWGYS